MVGVLGPNPSVDTGRGNPNEGVPLFLFMPSGLSKAFQPALQFKDHLVMVLKTLAVTPAMTARRINVYRGRNIMLI